MEAGRACRLRDGPEPWSINDSPVGVVEAGCLAGGDAERARHPLSLRVPAVGTQDPER